LTLNAIPEVGVTTATPEPTTVAEGGGITIELPLLILTVLMLILRVGVLDIVKLGAEPVTVILLFPAVMLGEAAGVMEKLGYVPLTPVPLIVTV
jgi:hypothetical protein